MAPVQPKLMAVPPQSGAVFGTGTGFLQPAGYMTASPASGPAGSLPTPAGACGSGMASGSIGTQFEKTYKRMKTADGHFVLVEVENPEI